MKHETKMLLLCVALAIAGCGGGGGGSSPEMATASSGTQVAIASPGSGGTGDISAPAATTAPGTATAVPAGIAPPVQAPNVVVVDDRRQPRPPWPVGADAPRTGVSLNWWGTHPQTLDDVNRSCGPQPDCVIPDGDLMEWNRFCDLGQDATGYPVEFCKVPLYDEPRRIEASPPLGTPPTGARPDPMTASDEAIAAWNRGCITARCMIVKGVPS